MTLLRRSLALTFLLLGLLPSAWAAAEAGPRIVRRVPAEDSSQARVIVKYRETSTIAAAGSAASARPQHAGRLAQRLGLPLQDGRVLGARTQALRGQGVTSAELARRLAALSDVEWAVVDQRATINAVVPNDPYYAANQTSITPTVGQWYLRAPDSSIVSAINAVGAWSVTTGSPTITVAVLDTGVRPLHPDLAGKLYPGYDFIIDAATSGDGEGIRDGDASDPGDWVTAGECGSGESASGSSWHGTQTAGLIGAATDNGVGMAGVGRNVMLLPVRVLGKCGGYVSDIIAAMRWAAGLSSDPVVNAHPARVINMSLGSSGSCSQAYRDVFTEVKAAGVSVVVAAGNENGFAVDSPANCPGAVAVAGLRHAGTKVGYSNVGPEVTIAAPAGNCVNVGASDPCLYPLLTTTNAGARTPSTDTYSDSYNYSVGTSFAAPLVAGTVALMLSADPSLTPDAVVARLKSTARAFPTSSSDASVSQCHAPNGQAQNECVCTTSTCGAGMLDAAAAVQFAPPTAAISASTTTPTAGDSVALNAGASSASGGRSIASYDWRISAGAATFNGATTGSTATLVTSVSGSVTVQLTVTDSAGASGSTTLVLAVQAPPAPPPAEDSGGGAFSALWVALLATAAVALRATSRRPRTAPRSPAA